MLLYVILYISSTINYHNVIDDGTARRSKSKPGFLHQLPGRKAKPFSKPGTRNHHKKQSVQEQKESDLTKNSLIEQKNRCTTLASADARAIVDLKAEHAKTVQSLTVRHDTIVYRLQRHIRALQMQVGLQKKRSNTFKQRWQSNYRDKKKAQRNEATARAAATTHVNKMKRKLAIAGDSVRTANKKIRMIRNDKTTAELQLKKEKQRSTNLQDQLGAVRLQVKTHAVGRKRAVHRCALMQSQVKALGSEIMELEQRTATTTELESTACV